MAAKIIYLDGPKGAGKSTVIQELTRMSAAGEGCFKDLKVSFAKEPNPNVLLALGGIDKVLSDPYGAVMAFSADRAIQAEAWKQSGDLENLDLIIVDRSPISTLAYQGRFFKKKWLDRIIERSMVNLTWNARHYLIFQLPFVVAHQRVFSRDGAMTPTQIGELYTSVEFFNEVENNKRAQVLGQIHTIEAESDPTTTLERVYYHIQDILEDE